MSAREGQGGREGLVEEEGRGRWKGKVRPAGTVLSPDQATTDTHVEAALSVGIEVVDLKVSHVQSMNYDARPKRSEQTHLARDSDGATLLLLSEGDDTSDLGVTLEDSDSLVSQR